jgi:hypothetical protein
VPAWGWRGRRRTAGRYVSGGDGRKPTPSPPPWPSQHGRALAEFAAMEGHRWERWDQLTPSAQRALVTAIVDHITVHPAWSRHWNPDHIADPIWRA